MSGAKHRSRAGQFFVVLFTFLALQAQIVVLVSAFVMSITVLSVSCLLFFYSFMCPRAQTFVKVGHVPPVPYMESAPLDTFIIPTLGKELNRNVQLIVSI